MAIDLKHMLKVYNYVNDDKKPKVNLKFLALFAALGIAVASLVVFSAIRPASDSTDTYASQSEFVGLSATEVAAGVPASVAETRLASWQAQHPGVEVVSIEAVYDDGRLIGYEVTYRG